MKPLTNLEMLEAYAKATGKPCMYVGFAPDDPSEIAKAAPYLAGDYRTLLDGYAFLVFDTAEERDEAFAATVGDDGPTRLNPYDGPARVFAVTAGPEGLLNENT